MALLMRDSTNPDAIPLDNLTAVAGYADGIYTWPSSGWARFKPPIVPLSIVCVSAFDYGDILDVEQGCETPVDVAGWCDRFVAAGRGRRAPTIYVNRSNWPAVKAVVGSRKVDYWVATLDGTKDIAGAVAVQYAGSAQTGGNYDESVILDPTWIGLSGGSSMSWDGKYPMPDPFPPGVGVTVNVAMTGTVKTLDGAGNPPHWFDQPDGNDQGPATAGMPVTVWAAAFDGANWWLKIEAATGPAPDNWYLLAHAVDTGGLTVPLAWNIQNKPVQPPPTPSNPLDARVADLEAKVAKLEVHVHSVGLSPLDTGQPK